MAAEQKNRLESLLEKALTEPGWRPEFFRVLMESSVWVPGEAVAGHSMNTDNSVELQHWEKQDATRVIPFFSSQQALRQAAGEQQAFVVMPVRTLFEITCGETLLLNAKLPQGKEFTPQEITRLLGGDNNPLSQQQVLQGGVPLLLSALEQPPERMINSLITLFQNIKQVKRAFICTVKEQAGQQANLLIGIEAEGDISTIIQTAGSVAADILPEDEAVDLCQITNDDTGISHFMITHIAPFYQRRWGSFLRDFQKRII